jgi:glycosyltransferase involved in cell wall biosynthesis
MKIKVLHIIPDLGSGGAERLVVDLVKFTDKSKFDVRVCVLYDKKGTPLEEELDDLKIKTYYLGKKLGPDLRILWRLYRLLKRWNPDVIHTHLSVIRYSLIPAIVCRIPRMVHTVHNQPEFEVEAIGKLVHKIAYRIRVVPVIISKLFIEDMQSIYGDIEYKLIYNGVDTLRFQAVDLHECRNLAIKLGLENKYIFLHIGRFAKQKDHELLIRSFKKICDSYSQAVLLLVGEGETFENVNCLVESLGIKDKVLFLGKRTDTPYLMNIADAVILSSEWEGLPITLLEAMAASKPVIATSVGGIPELILHGENGYLVKHGDSEGLAQAAIQLMQNSDIQNKFAINAKNRSKSFDIKRTVIEYQNLYLEEKA